MQVIIKITTDNAAFGDNDSQECAAEIVRILRDYCDKVEQGSDLDRTLRDLNGNKIGGVEFID